MKLGYTRNDLLVVGYSEVAWCITAIGQENAKVRDATQEDIDNF